MSPILMSQLVPPPDLNWYKTYSFTENIHDFVKTDFGFTIITGDYDAKMISVDFSGDIIWEQTKDWDLPSYSNRVSLAYVKYNLSHYLYMVAGSNIFGEFKIWTVLAVYMPSTNTWNISSLPLVEIASIEEGDVIYESNYNFIIAGNDANGDLHLIKVQYNGTILWEKVFENGSNYYDDNDRVTSVRKTSDNGFIILTTSDKPGDRHVRLIRTDSNGNEIWSKDFDYDGSISRSLESIDNVFTFAYQNTEEEVCVTNVDGSGNINWEYVLPGGDSSYFIYSIKYISTYYVVVGERAYWDPANEDDLSMSGNGFVLVLRDIGNKVSYFNSTVDPIASRYVDVAAGMFLCGDYWSYNPFLQFKYWCPDGEGQIAEYGFNPANLPESNISVWSAKNSIFLSLSEDMNLEIKVFDIQGRLIRNLSRGKYSQGSHEILWDGMDDNGNCMTNGMYLFSVTGCSGVFVSDKIVLMK